MECHIGVTVGDGLSDRGHLRGGLNGRGMSRVDMGKNIPSRGNAKHRGPEAGAGLVCVEDQARVAGGGEEGARSHGALAF